MLTIVTLSAFVYKSRVPKNYIQCCLSSSFLCSLEKRVNKKVMAMFEKAEDEYNDLISKKNIIEVSIVDLFGKSKHGDAFNLK